MLLTLMGWVGCAVSLTVALDSRRRLTAAGHVRRRACHEVRGALTAAGLCLEVEGRAGRLAPGRRRALELELGRAATAIDDLLPGVRASWRRDELDVTELLADSIEAWAPAAQQRGVDLRLSWSGPPALIHGDRWRLAQVTGNLIANALEHGAGPVQVTGRAEGDRVRIEVQDSGSGLRAPVSELVRRGRRGRGRRGHGLAVACAVAAAHGGRVAAAPSSTGARLVVELPLSPRAAQSSLH